MIARALGLSLALIALLSCLSFALTRAPFFADFRAFYCGSHVALHGADPYLQEPLYACESSAEASPLIFHTSRNIAFPDPFPGYALAAFAPLAALPLGIAAALWFLILVAAIVLTLVAFERLAHANVWMLALVATLNTLPALALGQVTPVVLAALSWAALALESQRFYAATALLGVAALDPHVAIAALLSVLVWEARARIPLLALGCVLAIVSIAFGGFSQTVEYVERVLPAHALSELHHSAQLGLSALLYQAGATVHDARQLGTLQYLLFLVAAVASAGRMVSATGRRAMIVVWPVSVVAIGGTFAHDQHVALIIPFTLVMLDVFPNVAIVQAAFVSSCLPWFALVESRELWPAGMIAAIAVTFLGVRTSLARRLAALAVIAGLVVGANALTQGLPRIDWNRVPERIPAPANALAEQSWKSFVDTFPANTGRGLARAYSLCSALLATVAGVLALRKKSQPS